MIWFKEDDDIPDEVDPFDGYGEEALYECEI